MGCLGCLGNVVSVLAFIGLLGFALPAQERIRPEDCNYPYFSEGGESLQTVYYYTGPGYNRSQAGILTPEENYVVTGQAVVDGETWYQLGIGWVPSTEDIEIVGNCSNVPTVEPPPIIPAPPPDTDGDGVLDDVDACPEQGDAGYGLGADGCPLPPPEEPVADGPGEWLACGSCGPCDDGLGTLHASSECVTSPDGQCLWDPATCVPEGHAPPPPPPPDGDIYD